MLPDTLLFETAKESLDDPILFRRIRRYELLLQPIVSTGLPKTATLNHQTVIAMEDRIPDWAQRPDSLKTRGFDRPFSLLGAAPQGKFIPNHFAIMTIDHRSEMGLREVARESNDVDTNPKCSRRVLLRAKLA